MKQLREYQQDSLAILNMGVAGLDASEMGTGKTLVAVEWVRGRQFTGPPRVLVIAPINTHYGWVSTFREQFPSLANATNANSIRVVGTFKKDPEGWEAMLSKSPGVFVVGWEAMRGQIIYEKDEDGNKTDVVKENRTPPWHLTGTWDVVIADECHRGANRRSQTHRVLKTIKAKNKLALSGTPAGNKPEGLWATLNWLWPKKYPYFWPWANTVLDVVPDPFAGRKIVGEKRPGSIWDSIPVVVRHRLQDVADKLPPVVERTVMVDMAPQQRRIYKRFEEEAFAWLDEHPVATPLPVTQRIRLRQVALGKPSAIENEDGKVEVYFSPTATSPKINALIDIMEDIPPQEPVLVLTHSRRVIPAVIHQVNKKFGQGTAVEWSGNVPPAKRQELIEQFGRTHRVIVAVISAIGEGTDGLQYVCAYEVWLSQDENNLLNTQAAKRLPRTGQTRPVQRWYIHSNETIDVLVYERLQTNARVMARTYRDE